MCLLDTFKARGTEDGVSGTCCSAQGSDPSLSTVVPASGESPLSLSLFSKVNYGSHLFAEHIEEEYVEREVT